MNVRHHYFFFNDTATTEIYTLSLHDALPIFIGRLLIAELLKAGHQITVMHRKPKHDFGRRVQNLVADRNDAASVREDRKSTRLNSSHSQFSYAVFCLKNKT